MKGSAINREDGHGPVYGCGWNKCGNPTSIAACPFTKDDDSAGPKLSAADSCTHEWRQFLNWDVTLKLVTTEGFYCIYCLMRHD